MKSTSKVFQCGVAALAILFVAASFSQAATIIKLNLGGVGPNVGMDSLGNLSTVDQTGGPPPTGDQTTSIEYTDFLNYIPDVNTNSASFSLNGLSATGPATVFGGSLVIQNFTGGIFSLYGADDSLLLQGPMADSALSGVKGPPGTGALFTTALGSVTGGSLASLLAPGTISLSMNMTFVNGGAGFTVSGVVLNPFLADATVSIAAAEQQVPEPTTAVLLILCSVGAVAIGRRR